MNLPTPMRSLVERLTPRQRQYAMLGAILLGGVGLLWLVFAFAESAPSSQANCSPVTFRSCPAMNESSTTKRELPATKE